MKGKLQIGQTLYLKPIGNAARRTDNISEVSITTIGNKYFTVNPVQYGKFQIDGMYQWNGEYSSNYIAYLSMKDILDERELAENLKVIKNYAFTIEQSRAIMALIG